MLKQFKRLLIDNSTLLKPYSNSVSNTVSNASEKWDLLTAVCVERRPVITPQLNELEKQFKVLLSEIELERSLKSDFELKQELEVKQLEQIKKGTLDSDAELALKQTTQDLIDAYTIELSQFEAAKLTTDADKKNDTKSLKRKLDKHLILLLNQKIGGKSYYLLPQGYWKEGETLRQSAERILKESCGSDMKAQFYGNAPAGFYKYKYPKPVQSEKGVCGAKVYIYFARHRNGQLPEKECDYKWLDHAEMSKILPNEYYKSVRQFLIDEN